MDSDISPIISPVQSVIECLSGWVELNGPVRYSAEIGRESPLLGEVRSRKKSRFGCLFTKKWTSPLFSDAAATGALVNAVNLTDP